jgi:hypothetical protein
MRRPHPKDKPNMTHVASAASQKQSTPRLPGFLLSPFGWVAEPLAAIVSAESTLVADLFEMSQPRMHLIALALAHLQPPLSPEIGRVLTHGCVRPVLEQRRDQRGARALMLRA